jgi:glycosyltransferase involved in cell wall biosynthesis
MGKKTKQTKQNKPKKTENNDMVIREPLCPLYIKPKYPKVSICTPTFNRRPFWPYIIKCFENQTYPKDKLEWIIIDDGTDKIEDLVSHIPQVKYYKFNEKMTLGKKRNLMHDKSSGDFIVYMDDDDYYPPERVSHAIETLQKNPNALCSGSSEMYIYFKHVKKVYQFGPYKDTHATAATFAFRRELLQECRYDEEAAVAEEKSFLKNYTIPFVQLNPLKTILVFSHIHNSFDKKELLKNKAIDKFINDTARTVDDFVKEPELKKFYMEDVDDYLQLYEPGKPEHKPDVAKQLAELKVKREKMMAEEQQRMMQMQNNQNTTIQQLSMENSILKEKISYLEDKISKLISEKIIALKSNQ